MKIGTPVKIQSKKDPEILLNGKVVGVTPTTISVRIQGSKAFYSFAANSEISPSHKIIKERVLMKKINFSRLRLLLNSITFERGDPVQDRSLSFSESPLVDLSPLRTPHVAVPSSQSDLRDSLYDFFQHRLQEAQAVRALNRLSHSQLQALLQILPPDSLIHSWSKDARYEKFFHPFPIQNGNSLKIGQKVLMAPVSGKYRQTVGHIKAIRSKCISIEIVTRRGKTALISVSSTSLIGGSHKIAEVLQ